MASDLQRRLFLGFEHRELATARGPINAVIASSGPPLRLLHGYPQSLLMWHATAPVPAERRTVVATDLAGYGASLRPRPGPDHRPHAKRESALDQVEAMSSLGFESYRRSLRDPGAVEAMCEDYRAGASVDADDDDVDRAEGRRIECPLLVLWAGRGALPRLYPSVVDVWRPWARDIAGAAIDARHFMAEESPRETADQLLGFL